MPESEERHGLSFTLERIFEGSRSRFHTNVQRDRLSLYVHQSNCLKQGTHSPRLSYSDIRILHYSNKRVFCSVIADNLIQYSRDIANQNSRLNADDSMHPFSKPVIRGSLPKTKLSTGCCTSDPIARRVEVCDGWYCSDTLPIKLSQLAAV